MYDSETGEWVVDGVSADVDTLFRIRDHLLSATWLEMSRAGYISFEDPQFDWNQEDGLVKYQIRWGCIDR